MQNTLISFLKATLIVCLWAGLLTSLGVWLFRHYSVSPTFPYYYILLLNVKDAAYALWGYFDGVHYLRLIDYGYVDTGTQAFFPLYPLIARGFKQLFSVSGYFAGILVSLLSLTLALFSLWRLYPKHRAIYTLSLLLFPTSFFLLGLYTESLFLFLSLSFFLALKQKAYLLAALFSSLASATRVVGILLAFSLLIELYQHRSEHSKLKILSLFLLSTSGLVLYMIFLNSRFGDPLIFMHVQSMFGAGRSGGELILLPQVLYRYLKMIFTVDQTTFIYQRLWLELIFFFGAVIMWYRNLRTHPWSLNFYIAVSLLIPTLTGTLSSIPRYVLVLVPFLLPTKLKAPRYLASLLVGFILLLYLFTYFAHGTFVA